MNELNSYINNSTEIVKELSWNNHFCYFYYTIDQLLDFLVPFFSEGLENNQYCIWIIPNSLSEKKAIQLLKNRDPKYESIYGTNQFEIIDFRDFYHENNEINFRKPFKFLKNILKHTRKYGFEGARISGDTKWLKKKHLNKFIEYEVKIDKKIKTQLLLVACTYPINKFIKSDILAIANVHDFAVFAKNDTYKVIKSNERERLEEEKRKIDLKLENLEKINNVGVLTSSIAHDFNNLLTLIKGYADMAQMNIENDWKTNNYLQEISKSIKGAAKLIHRLLDMSREKKLFREVINVNEIIENLLEMLSYFIAENIKVETNLDKDLRKIKANPEKIEQILMNLIINSRDAMPEGGKLIIKTNNIEKSQLSEVKQRDCAYENLVCISVQDEGIGIKKSEIEKIFKPFYTTKESGKGTGLGLSIVKNFVSQHNGWIEVESEVNNGSNFRVFIPSEV